jgi:uncharacterized protein (DUF1330 family)
MSAYLVCELHDVDTDTAKLYLPMVEKVVAQYGGEYLARAGAAQLLEGVEQPGRMVILKFPDREALLAFYNSSEYSEPKQMRQNSARCRLIVLDGVDEK